MKKLALLLAALLALLSLAPALADAAEEPILFRGIEWGTTYEAIAAEVEMSALDWDTAAGTSAHEKRHNSYFDEFSSDSHAFTARVAYSDSEIEAISDIAGYPLKHAYLYFVYIPEADGTFVKDDAHAALYCAQYEVGQRPADPDLKDIDVMEDLIGKLSALYGEYEYEKEGDYNSYVWHGAEGTSVALTIWPDVWGTNYITYGYDGGNELLEQAQAVQDAINAAKDAKKDEFSKQTNGL